MHSFFLTALLQYTLYDNCAEQNHAVTAARRLRNAPGVSSRCLEKQSINV